MKFRYARHTNDLNRIEKFYIEIVGLEKLGGFDNHDNYNGIFLGFPDQDWHLEFTVSEDQTQSKFDEDDILVFYLDTGEELDAVKHRLMKNNIPVETSKNPYWNKHGVQVADPDGYKIVFSRR